VTRLLPLLVLGGCSLATDFDRTYPGEPEGMDALVPDAELDATAPDIWRLDAAPHERLELCRDWCPDFAACLAVQCGHSANGPGTQIASGFCLAACLENNDVATQDATRTCRSMTATRRQREAACRDNGFPTCEGMCEGGEAYLTGCYGVDADCVSKCEGISDEEFLCTGYELAQLDLSDDPDPIEFCGAISNCIDWPDD